MGIQKHVKDIAGMRFGRLTAIKVVGTSKTGCSIWEFECDCGNKIQKIGAEVRCGSVRSCGCLRRETTRNRTITHGQSKTRLYKIWHKMRDRCSDSAYGDDKRLYYERGIRVCEEWSQFEPFMIWAIENGYEHHLSIDRVDVNGNYEPNNCRWATPKEQARNTRHNVYVEVNDERMTKAEMTERYGIDGTTFDHRIRKGWSETRAAITPTKPIRRAVIRDDGVRYESAACAAKANDTYKQLIYEVLWGNQRTTGGRSYRYAN